MWLYSARFVLSWTVNDASTTIFWYSILCYLSYCSDKMHDISCLMEEEFLVAPYWRDYNLSQQGRQASWDQLGSCQKEQEHGVWLPQLPVNREAERDSGGNWTPLLIHKAIISDGPLSPVRRLHLQSVPPPPQTASPSGEQLFKLVD